MWPIYCDMTYCSNMLHIYWDMTYCSNMWHIYRTWEQLAPLGCFLFADLFRYHNDVKCFESLSANTLLRHFCWQLGSFHSISTSGMNAEWNQALLLVVGACVTVWGIGNISEVTTHRDFTRVGNFYQAFCRYFSARTEFDLNHCRNCGNVFTLFILSLALHLIAERLASSTADTIFD